MIIFPITNKNNKGSGEHQSIKNSIQTLISKLLGNQKA
jgi:hypothetical protein